MKKSSSLHNINGDKPLTMVRRLLYIVLNLINNWVFPNRIPREVTLRDFKVEISDDDLEKISWKGSPSRMLSNLFWMKLPWEDIQSELGQINVLDVGCGSGGYSDLLVRFSENRIATYVGVDIKPHNRWAQYEMRDPTRRFHVSRSEDFYKQIPEITNLVISQSALEHFEQDLVFFRNISRFVVLHQKRILQIHLLPSADCLKLYGFHGVRQYTPRTISQITGLFSDFSYSVIYKLGGRSCNILHMDYITKPLRKFQLDFRNTRPNEYRMKLLEAIKVDMNQPSQQTNFYALIVHSNWGNPLFRPKYPDLNSTDHYGCKL